VNFINVKIIGAVTHANENEVGLKVNTNATLNHMNILNSVFSRFDYGLYFPKHGDWLSGSNVTFFNITASSFTENDDKAAYIEKLSDAVFTNMLVHNNGLVVFWNSRWNAGSDLNLKSGTYQNISFLNCNFSANGLGFYLSLGADYDTGSIIIGTRLIYSYVDIHDVNAGGLFALLTVGI
jgi:hypothetical protein